jgi:hypothetical protein
MAEGHAAVGSDMPSSVGQFWVHSRSASSRHPAQHSTAGACLVSSRWLDTLECWQVVGVVGFTWEPAATGWVIAGLAVALVLAGGCVYGCMMQASMAHQKPVGWWSQILKIWLMITNQLTHWLTLLL